MKNGTSQNLVHFDILKEEVVSFLILKVSMYIGIECQKLDTNYYIRYSSRIRCGSTIHTTNSTMKRFLK